MRNIFFKVANFIIKVIRYFLYFVTASISLGLAVVLFHPAIIHQFAPLEHSSSITIHVSQVITIFIIALFIQVSIIYFLKKSELLLSNCSNNILFVSENIVILNKMMLSLIVWTGIQFVSIGLLESFKIDGVSDIFNFYFKDYMINFLLIGITYIIKVILSHGMERQKEYDQII